MGASLGAEISAAFNSYYIFSSDLSPLLSLYATIGKFDITLGYRGCFSYMELIYGSDSFYKNAINLGFRYNFQRKASRIGGSFINQHIDSSYNDPVDTLTGAQIKTLK